MPTFNDSNNQVPVLEEGDYVFCVVGLEIGLSNGAKTRGSDKYTLELEIEPSGKSVMAWLIDHPSQSWKIDTFLKSAGVKLAKGQPFQFIEETAKQQGVTWVNPIGLRGWCRLIQKELDKKEGQDKPKVVNEVQTFYTDRPKLAARVIETAEEDRPF